MAKTTKFKVPVKALLERAQEMKRKEDDRYKKEQDKYELALIEWRAKVIAAVEGADAEKLARSDSAYGDNNYRNQYYIKVKVPRRPEAPPRPNQKHDRVIRLLAAA